VATGTVGPSSTEVWKHGIVFSVSSAGLSQHSDEMKICNCSKHYVTVYAKHAFHCRYLSFILRELMDHSLASFIIREEITSRLNVGNVFCHSVQIFCLPVSSLGTKRLKYTKL
jgi:hypothetical protein